MTKCVVYWKHTEDMSSDYSDGYIGISKNYEERMKQHHRDAFIRNSIYTVHERMRMYGDDVITDIIFKGSINDCFDYEEELRPRWHMGWNIAIGGGRPGSGWKEREEWLDRKLYHNDHGEIEISANFTTTDLARKYLPNTSISGSSGNLGRVLEGRRYHVGGWMLSNETLRNKVAIKYYNKWEHVYIRPIYWTDYVISLHRSGFKRFRKECSFRESLQCLANGSDMVRCKWELASKEEWLATTERLEFK